MKTYRDEVRELLLNYPTLFRTKLDVARHLFLTNGNGRDWTENGTLEVERFNQPPLKNEMDYSDLDEDKEKNREIMAEALQHGGGLMHLYAFREAEIEAQRMVRFMTNQYMDVILDAKCGQSLFDRNEVYSWHRSYDPKEYHPEPYDSYRYYAIFTYPDNIAKDWAEGLLDFVKSWRYKLNVHFHIGHQDHPYAHWSEDALRLRDKLDGIINDLTNKVTGTTPEQRAEQHKEILALLNKDAKKDLKSDA